VPLAHRMGEGWDEGSGVFYVLDSSIGDPAECRAWLGRACAGDDACAGTTPQGKTKITGDSELSMFSNFRSRVASFTRRFAARAMR
jgi:hypothetical protein